MNFIVSQDELRQIIEQLHEINKGYEYHLEKEGRLERGLVGLSLNLVSPKPSSGSAAGSFDCPHCGNSIKVRK